MKSTVLGHRRCQDEEGLAVTQEEDRDEVVVEEDTSDLMVRAIPTIRIRVVVPRR